MNQENMKLAEWTGMSNDEAYKAIVNLCRRCLARAGGHDPDPHDVAQDVVAAILSHKFGRGFDAKGSRWAFVVGTIKMLCFKRLAQAKRRARGVKRFAQLPEVSDPFLSVSREEFKQAISELRGKLSLVDQSVLDSIMQRAEGGHPRTRMQPYQYARAANCRRRVRHLLELHRPDGARRHRRRKSE